MNKFFIVFALVITCSFAESFYTISVCTTSTYKDALFCKDNLLKEFKDDVNIIKLHNEKYRTNLGVFETFSEAKTIQKNIEKKNRKNKLFIIEMNSYSKEFEFYEIFSAKSSDKLVFYPEESTEQNTTSIQSDTIVSKKHQDDNNLSNLPQKEKNNSPKIGQKPQIFADKKLIETKINPPPSTHITKAKTIFLTFDDGPMRGTNHILEVLESEQVPATLFFVGRQIHSHKKIFNKSLNNPYVTIGNHTYSHANGQYQLFYSNKYVVFQDIKKNEQIASQAKHNLKLSSFLPVRLAGRNVFRTNTLFKNDLSIGKEQSKKEVDSYNYLASGGFYLYGWDIEWLYSPTGKPKGTPYQIVEQIEKMNRTKTSLVPNKVVLLMHDYMFINRFNGKQNLQTLIELLKNRGWQFGRIEDFHK